MKLHNLASRLVLVAFLPVLAACTKDENNNTNNGNNFSTPPAQPANDTKSGGLYKGTLCGSSGSFYINLQSNDNKMYAIFDGVRDTLSTTATITSGTAISNAAFTGHTGMALNFSVNADGTSPSVNSFTVPGHPFAEAFLFKETSSVPVKVFEGRFTKTTTGTNCQSGLLNIVVSGTVVNGYHKEDGGQHLAGTFSVPVANGQFNFTAGSGTGVCTINSNESMITGTASDINGCASTISCARTY